MYESCFCIAIEVNAHYKEPYNETGDWNLYQKEEYDFHTLSN